MDEFLYEVIRVFLKTPKDEKDKVLNGYLYIQVEYGSHIANCALALHRQIHSKPGERKVVD